VILYHRQVLDPDQTSQLVASAAGGDRDAWDQLVGEFSGLVWSVIRGCGLYGAEASDVSQTVWLRFVEHIDRLRQTERAGAWLATTARHECFRVQRRQGRQVVTAEVPEVAGPDDSEAVVDALVAADDRGAVLVALGRIPARCQELLRLMTVEPRLTYDDIAATLGVPRGWIGPTRGRCLNHLRRALEVDAGEVPVVPAAAGGADATAGTGIRHEERDSGHVKEADR
jgi:RNA polymerase sigma factor (sigma-70 family)